MGQRPNTSFPKSDPRYHTANVLAALDDLIRHLREDTREFDEPKAHALFETGAEVLVACGPRSSTTRAAPKRRCANRAAISCRHAAIARALRAAHVAEPQATVKPVFPVPSRRVTHCAA